MAEKVIRNNESIAPFFGERLSFIRGLDPMGMQNTSDATFSLLLPGLNNVTNLIRYYSFYCWLLDQYSKTNGSTDPKEQKRFIRYAEYTIALASYYLEDGHSGIPGSQFAQNEIEKKGLTTHNLQEATFNADGSTRGRYWTYPMGAFGQYYYGSLRSIGIITENENYSGVYIRINDRNDSLVSGEALANAFDANISSKVKNLFISIIQKGEVTTKELKLLMPDFKLTSVPQNTEEQTLLLKLLIQKDYPLRIEDQLFTYRNQTVKHLLYYLKNNKEDDFTDRLFVYYCYYSKGKFNGLDDDCLLGWYYYQFNEFWHYANTSMLNGVLDFLFGRAGLKWMAIPQLVEEITSTTLSYFQDNGFITDETDQTEVLLKKFSQTDDYEFFEKTSDAKAVEKLANAFLSMFALYQCNVDELIILKEFAERSDVARDGEGTGYFLSQFSAKKDYTIRNFIYDYILVNVIYRHQYVAFRKIRGGIQSTQKFIIEDQYIRFIKNFDASFTGPRVGNLIRYLIDLDAITDKFQLTDTGETLLEKLQEEKLLEEETYWN